MKIEFIWNGSIVGRSHSLKIDDKYIDLGLAIVSEEEEAKLIIIEYLKNNYNLEYDINNINFKWGGQL